jgi:hypothetical protein
LLVDAIHCKVLCDLLRLGVSKTRPRPWSQPELTSGCAANRGALCIPSVLVHLISGGRARRVRILFRELSLWSSPCQPLRLVNWLPTYVARRALVYMRPKEKCMAYRKGQRCKKSAYLREKITRNMRLSSDRTYCSQLLTVGWI